MKRRPAPQSHAESYPEPSATWTVDERLGENVATGEGDANGRENGALGNEVHQAEDDERPTKVLSHNQHRVRYGQSPCRKAREREYVARESTTTTAFREAPR